MVTPPALRAATEALLQLQTGKNNTSPNNSQHAKFSSELTKQLGQQTTHVQNHTLIANSINRPIVFLPIATELSTQNPQSATTHRRTKKNKASQATSAYNSSILPKR